MIIDVYFRRFIVILFGKVKNICHKTIFLNLCITVTWTSKYIFAFRQLVSMIIFYTCKTFSMEIYIIHMIIIFWILWPFSQSDPLEKLSSEGWIYENELNSCLASKLDCLIRFLYYLTNTTWNQLGLCRYPASRKEHNMTKLFLLPSQAEK